MAIGRRAGFLLDDGGQGQRLVRAAQRQAFGAFGPGRVQTVVARNPFDAG